MICAVYIMVTEDISSLSNCKCVMFSLQQKKRWRGKSNELSGVSSQLKYARKKKRLNW